MRQTEKPTDDRPAEGTGRREEVSQSTPQHPRGLAMEFLHFLVNIILEITQVENKESQISTMVEQIKNSCLCMVSP